MSKFEAQCDCELDSPGVLSHLPIEERLERWREWALYLKGRIETHYRPEVERLKEQGGGHEQPCYYCGESCDSLNAHPSRWPVPLCHADEPGVVKWHHIGCVAERLAEVERLKVGLHKMAWLVRFYQGTSTLMSRMVPEVRLAELKRELELHAALTDWAEWKEEPSS